MIIHGCPSKEEYLDKHNPSPAQSHWLPWIKEQLELKEVKAETPEMPIPYEPNYEAWKNIFEQFQITEETILIGHSCGGGFLIRWLSEHPERKVEKVLLVAPWLDPAGEIAPFFTFSIDATMVRRAEKVVVFYSTDDEDTILRSVSLLKEKLPDAIFREFADKGHFCYEDLGTTAFPELLAEIDNK